MDWNTILVSLLSSATAVAVITAIKELVLWKLNRKAAVEDREDSVNDRLDRLENAKNDVKSTVDEHLREYTTVSDTLTEMKETLKDLSEQVKSLSDDNLALKKGVRYILGKQIETMALEAIKAESITYNQRRILHDMWNTYHHGLGANGDLDNVMSEVNKLPLDFED